MRYLRLLLVVATVAGCARQVSVDDRIPGDIPRWCFEAEYRPGKYTRRAAGCFETKDLCDRALALARRYGRYGRMKKLSRCAVRR